MPRYDTLRRYALILEKVQAQDHPTFQSISRFLENNSFEVSARTIQRDIDHLRLDFGVDIVYDRSRNGYYIDAAQSQGLHSLLGFLQLANEAQIVRDALDDARELLKYVQFDSVPPLKGIQNVGLILRSIKERHELTFLHRKFGSEAPCVRVVVASHEPR
jgi:hypothetical protein